MMSKRPEMNLEHPPGQIINRDNPRYLRDVIKKYQEEEGCEPLTPPQAPLPSTSAEKRLEGLLGALAGLCKDHAVFESAYYPDISVWEIRDLIEEYEKA